jgi:hypothetical protein
MPFRNAEQTLPECLDSIREQSLRSWELIAVDDGSSDGSPALIDGDPRFRLLSPGRVGLVGALNLGIDSSRAPLIARMDADDLMASARLGRQLEFLRAHPRVSLVATGVELFPEEEIQAGFREYLRWQDGCVAPDAIAANIFVESPFVHPTVMFRRSAEMLYREGPFPEDYELWLRMHECGLSMGKIPEPLLRWRLRPGRATATDPRYSRAAFDALRARFLARDSRVSGARELVIWGAGRRTRLRLRSLLSLGVSPSAWIDIDPRKIGRTAEGRPVLGPDSLERSPRPFVLVCVTSHGSREIISGRLERLGYRLGEDYLPVGI